MKYYHVDVFSPNRFGGNGLTAVFVDSGITASDMLLIAQEFKQFETVFIFPRTVAGYPIRIFTVQEELTFAGHPVLGVGGIIHKVFHGDQNTLSTCVLIGDRKIELSSSLHGSSVDVTMNQGEPLFVSTVSPVDYEEIVSSLNLSLGDLSAELPIEVVSTGLPYLLVPLRSNLERAKINVSDFEGYISNFGAKFVYVFDASTLECRTWDNTGVFEDVATGSAAGPLVAYLIKNGRFQRNEQIELHQGRYVGRPSVIRGSWSVSGIRIEGEVAFFASGEIEI